uniref:Uncharacterized protein n=1 Tax=Arion vulgaris TaxID=1028688 RepID=A0A0B6XVV4_9EUPU
MLALDKKNRHIYRKVMFVLKVSGKEKQEDHKLQSISTKLFSVQAVLKEILAKEYNTLYKNDMEKRCTDIPCSLHEWSEQQNILVKILLYFYRGVRLGYRFIQVMKL